MSCYLHQQCGTTCEGVKEYEQTVATLKAQVEDMRLVQRESFDLILEIGFTTTDARVANKILTYYKKQLMKLRAHRYTS